MNNFKSKQNCLTIDVEDWFHILETKGTPDISEWDKLESRVEFGVERLLGLLEKYSVKATMFWLGWIAERNKRLVRECFKAGHEIASHGYGHVLPYKVSRNQFFEDAEKAKKTLEDITSNEVIGYRAAGFGIKDENDWFFEETAKAGYKYDSSIFPGSREHGGSLNSKLNTYAVDTDAGEIIEFPQSVVQVLEKRVSFFGGGYLRLAPSWLINKGIKKLEESGRPLIIYVHPREVDPGHPRIEMSLKRKFKSYVNLKSTYPKLEMLCQRYKFVPMREMFSTRETDISFNQNPQQ